jgi:hypothetical protein
MSGMLANRAEQGSEVEFATSAGPRCRGARSAAYLAMPSLLITPPRVVSPERILMDLTASPVRSLPRRVRPFPSESTESYVRRMAEANYLSVSALRRHITGGQGTGRIPPRRLAAAAGLPMEGLQRALPDLTVQGKPRTTIRDGLPVPTHAEGMACRLCAARYGCQTWIWTLRPPEHVVCRRHLRWLGVRPANGTQPILEHQPDVVRAHLRHLRLVRRYGRSDVACAYAAAEWICGSWYDVGLHRDRYERRLGIFRGPRAWRVAADDPAVDASAYPEVVALARLLISPNWLSVATSGNPRCQRRFQAEIRGTVAPHYVWPQPPGARDPLFQYLRDLAAVSPRRDPDHGWPGDIFGATTAYLDARVGLESHTLAHCDALFSATTPAAAGTAP